MNPINTPPVFSGITIMEKVTLRGGRRAGSGRKKGSKNLICISEEDRSVTRSITLPQSHWKAINKARGNLSPSQYIKRLLP